jgi:hypothetical protein
MSLRGLRFDRRDGSDLTVGPLTPTTSSPAVSVSFPTETESRFPTDPALLAEDVRVFYLRSANRRKGFRENSSRI